MQINSGTRLGPYEILSPLGAGGMGEVWKAKDTRLERSVAVKILPSALAQNAQLRIRFEREARAISQLNHPHICTVHDVGEHDGVDYLVMELLEGESLGERLLRGPLPLHEVVRFGVQIAEALDRAHRSGIVHRDLKPGNVMITKSGAKLLDFGLARASGPSATSPDTPTEHMPLTAEGTIVGTFQYMAPEQLAGEEADHRTDIFALGAVLYEMLTGTRAFAGKNKTSLIAAIVGGEPPRVSTIQPLTPPALEHVIARCLAKDPEERWQSAHDIAEELRWIGEAGSQAGVAAPLTSRRKNRERLFAGAAALLLLSAAALGWALWRERSKPARVQHLSIVAPAGKTFNLRENDSSALTLSPDGRFATFAVGDDIDSSLWLYSLETGEARELGKGGSPFWSPDSKSIAFFDPPKLKRIDVAGGPAVTITETGDGRGGTWNADGTIVFEPNWRDPLHRVSASGGKSTPVTTLDKAQAESTHRWPWFLPDGRHFLYLAASHKSAVDSDVNAIYLGSLDGAERKLLLRARSNAIYANGHVLFVRENYLMAQPFDPDKRELTGDPVRVAQNVTMVPGFFRALFGASADGTLAYFTGPAQGKREIKWTDLSGTELEKVVTIPELGNTLRLSPDRKRAVVTVGDPRDLWIVDLERKTTTRFTNEAMQEFSPVWSPDGTRIAYGSDASDFASIIEKATDGLSQPRVIFKPVDKYAEPTDWSPDGKFLLANVEGAHGEPDIWIVPPDGSAKARPFVQTEAAEFEGNFSPDGRWVSYESEESGARELYVMSFPDGRIKRQLTGSGVLGSGWLDGHSLLFATRKGEMLRIRVNGDSFGLPEPFTRLSLQIMNLDFSADQKRMLVIEEERITPPTITVINHWIRGLPGEDAR